jgi:hypothetical protein
MLVVGLIVHFMQFTEQAVHVPWLFTVKPSAQTEQIFGFEEL